MNLFSTLQDPAATKMRQAVRLFAEALLELAAEPEASPASTPAPNPVDAAAALADKLRTMAAGTVKPRSAPIVAAARRRSKSEELLPEVRRLAGSMPVTELVRAVGLGKSALYKLAKEHGLQLGQPEQQLKIDVAELRRLAPTTTLPELMERFGCTDGAVRLAAKAHNITLLPMPRGGRPAVNWTEAMLADLRAKAGKVPAPMLAEQLGVNRNPLFLKAGELGLSLAMEWTPERSAELASLIGTLPSPALAKHFAVTLSSLAAEAARQGLSLSNRPPKAAPAPTPPRAPKPANTQRPVTEVSAAVDEMPSRLVNGAWVEIVEPAPAAELADRSVLEGISYSITTPDRSPPSPELIEALQPVVEAAVAAMRADSVPAAEEKNSDAVEAIRERAAWEREADEEAGRAVAGLASLPVERRRPAKAVAVAKTRPAAAVRRGPVEAPSKWVRLQHPDGKLWLRMDGLEWTEKKTASYLVLRTKLPAALNAFPLARECKVISEPSWTAKDISYSGAMR